MPGEIDRLIAFVKECFPFVPEKYPELVGRDEAGQRSFAIKHVALHFAKTAGKIATASEGEDHGGEIDMADLRKNTAKALVNALRMAELAGMTGQELLSEIERIYAKKYRDS